MVFGKTPFDSRSYAPLLKEIANSKMFTTELVTCNSYTASKMASSFLKQVIRVDPKERLSWKQMLEHPMFKEDRELPGVLVADVNIEESHIEEEFSMPSLEDSSGSLVIKDSGKVTMPVGPPVGLTRVETKNFDIVQKLQNPDEKDFHWARELYLECQKAELIFKEVVTPIIQNELLDLSERKVVEMIYLLLSRCLFTMSIIRERLHKEGDNFQVKNLSSIVKELYQEI